MNNFLEWLPKGEWSYTKFKKEFETFRLKRKRDIVTEYIAQVPYFKVIGSPVFFLILLLECLPIIVQFFYENRHEFLNDFKSLFKKKVRNEQS